MNNHNVTFATSTLQNKYAFIFEFFAFVFYIMYVILNL